MSKNTTKKRIAILGGGPSGLFMFKRLIESGPKNYEIEIFERKGHLGMGMPYSAEGANDEHITNVSDNEIPKIFNNIEDWVKVAPKSLLKRFNINPEKFNEYKVLPRLFFGEYLSAQFDLLIKRADQEGISVKINLHSNVLDMIDLPGKGKVKIKVEGREDIFFDFAIICIGHNWPKNYEDKIPHYFDSPYPPKKLALKLNHEVGIKGAALTAIDAVRTLARYNGNFYEGNDGKLYYKINPEHEGFGIVMHSRNGLLPAIRFHLEDSHLGKDATLSKEEIAQNIEENDGFLSLDYVFDKNFKEMFVQKEPAFYKQIKNMSIETFVDAMMDLREKEDSFELFKKEYEEAEQSIKKRESVYWKEMLAVLSFAMNYPAKYFSAEDMQRLQQVLMPLISIVIAFVPQSSCREIMALYDAGLLKLIAVGDDSKVVPGTKEGATYAYTNEEGVEVDKHFKTFIDCTGQPHLSFNEFPFQRLIDRKTISEARIKFHSAHIGKKEMEQGNENVGKTEKGYYLKVPGITINDAFQVVDEKGHANKRIYIMAVPYIGGYNPDYSGIDFCEAASELIIDAINKGNLVETEAQLKVKPVK
ncbi:FAD/NAD(P)-binding protein [Pedobacter punctiformis]|uniref:FAD/NAD(P)-binding protein n=1 Tax=Pedobacter punctiformis TaxID=3004097 RepID=A0ABT4L862_9SPHI|nr:FAD/NAD(P)-binding protein [Pedobacter sp. HCMS5-2]MCZ4244100.1 FAD/NAD(P)-binding protein [Pedobacter sp. HCMS5-2]